MVAGAVDHQTGTRDINELGGLWRAMPLTALAALLAGLSMSGIPPLTGFVAKEYFYEATLYAPSWPPVSWLLTGAALVANVLTVAAAGLVVLRPFGSQRPTELEKPSEGSAGLWLGPIVLAGCGLAGGLLIGGVGARWIEPAVSAVAGVPVEVKLSLWHGINPMLILSIITIGLAAVVWVMQPRLLPATAQLDVGERYGPERGYGWLLGALPRLATRQTQWLQHGYLRHYLFVVVAVGVALVGFTFLSRVGVRLEIDWANVRAHEVALLGLMLAAAGLAVTAASRLVAIVAVGVVGLGMTLLFVFYSAPDLAMTQFAVETLTVLLFVFVLYRLPRFANLSQRADRLRDATLALLAGGLMTLLVLAAVQSPHPMHVSEYFAEQSWPAANGRNVVNVILVDFRALDTLGEIVVLIIAALGVNALIRPLVRNARRAEVDEREVAAAESGE